jgi:hypothetical protein
MKPRSMIYPYSAFLDDPLRIAELAASIPAGPEWFAQIPRDTRPHSFHYHEPTSTAYLARVVHVGQKKEKVVMCFAISPVTLEEAQQIHDRAGHLAHLSMVVCQVTEPDLFPRFVRFYPDIEDAGVSDRN